jgi:hypothetical protein
MSFVCFLVNIAVTVAETFIGSIKKVNSTSAIKKEIWE